MIFTCITAVLMLAVPAGADAATDLFLQSPGLIILDPGHGGDDPGAIGSYQDGDTTSYVYEKDVNLQIAGRVLDILKTRLPGCRVLMTRTEDIYVSLEDRAETANLADIESGYSKIFISIHANSAPGIPARGFEVWKLYQYVTHDFLSADIDETAIRDRAGVTNYELNRELDNADSILAESVRMSIGARLSGMTRDRGIKENNFYVLRYTYMPSILVETGFMTHEEELTNLIDPAYQQLIADAIVDGIIFYTTILDK